MWTADAAKHEGSSTVSLLSRHFRMNFDMTCESVAQALASSRPLEFSVAVDKVSADCLSSVPPKTPHFVKLL